MILTLSSLYMRYLVHIYCIDFGNVWMFAGIFSCTPSFSPEINKVYLILSYLNSALVSILYLANTQKSEYINLHSWCSKCISSGVLRAFCSWTLIFTSYTGATPLNLFTKDHNVWTTIFILMMKKNKNKKKTYFLFKVRCIFPTTQEFSSWYRPTPFKKRYVDDW